ncbi:carboxypeptidase-like regulatory domain-containing protein [Hymenobacter perfusus]|uniref:Carboxypeptidase-like regulatory domain-containing protein n=1 Tax=Hymenobacter perfusus TaxID=1236770 RepID=A0A428KJI9_9BACT|nr:carboxypeptidase-like regulatory domain-containing protein [Hymenobacter perfusus]RSK46554.1 carboxypeptidase-like regulatory domain-containing protein [Hymenobacter perfusus]
MPARFTVTIPQPCHESWAAMTPAAQGRHCAACDKVVVDFTRLTDAEVVAYLSQTNGRSCGRFRAEQLSRPLRVTADAPVSRRWLAAALAVLGLGVAGPAGAQTKSTAPQEQRQLPSEAAVSTATAADRIIRGRVTYAGSGEGLPGVTVLLKGTTIGVSTNSDGTFELPLPDSVDYEQLVLFTTVGFISEEHKLGSLLTKPGSIAIQLDTDVKGGLSFSACYTPRGLWQRLTRLTRQH